MRGGALAVLRDKQQTEAEVMRSVSQRWGVFA